MTRTRCRSCPGRTATLLRCCAEPGSTSDTVQCSDMGPGSAAHRRSLAAPLVGTKFWAHGEQSALPLASRTRTLPRPPQARLANVTTTRSPLKDEPGWATHTPKRNFGKVEYFCAVGLTGGRHSERIRTTGRSLHAHPVGVPCFHWPPAIFAAAITAWVRLSTPSFCRMAETCALMVASETPSS
jgi:hypothetical protein